MNLHFNIHNMFSIQAEGLQQGMNNFLAEELSFFKSDLAENADLLIVGKESIKIPANAVRLLKDLYYCNGEIFLERNGRLLSYSIKNWLHCPAMVYVEPEFPHWWLLYAVEKTMFMAAPKKGYCLLHASAMSTDGLATIVSSLQAGGKTLHALNNTTKKEYAFLGDDLIIIRGDGICFCYPRGINFNSFHGDHYKRAKKIYLQQMPAAAQIKFVSQNGIHFLYDIVRGQVPTHPIVRMPIQKVYADCKIITSAKTKEVVLKFASGNEYLCEADWPNSRVAHFLYENAIGELKNKIEPYITAISAYGDSCAQETCSTVNSLFNKQKEILSDFLRNVKVEIAVGEILTR